MKFAGNHPLLIGFLLRLFIAIWNGFFGPSYGADLDALSFHLGAVQNAASPMPDDIAIGHAYIDFLGLFYYLTIDSLFLGSLLSCIAWLASALLLASCLRILLVERNVQVKALLLYGLLPSSIVFTSITLRESYQLLFVNLAIYAALRIYLHKRTRHWFTLLIAIAGAASLHGALLAFGILLLAETLLLVSWRGRKIPWSKIIVMGSLAIAVLLYGLTLFQTIAYALDDGLVSSYELYQNNLTTIDARTNYKTAANSSDFEGVLLFGSVGFIQYLFEPFPWHMTSAIDIVALLENIMRGWLILLAWKAVRIASGQKRRVLLFIVISYLLIEVIWSAGTINWGTSIRHHLPAFGMLLLAAYGATDGKRHNVDRVTRILSPRPVV